MLSSCKSRAIKTHQSRGLFDAQSKNISRKFRASKTGSSLGTQLKNRVEGTMQPESGPGLFADVPDARRRIMRAIRSNETAPERFVRSALHREGYRFLKNVRGLPGRPDIIFPSRKKAVFVHGCFWHAHAGCSNALLPRTRENYWAVKLCRNVERDQENLAALKSAGWAAEVVWECELSDMCAVVRRLKSFLGSVKAPGPSKKLTQESDP